MMGSEHQHCGAKKPDHDQHPHGSCCAADHHHAGESTLHCSSTSEQAEHSASLSADAETYTHTWQIVGMDCPSCARKVETAVNRIDGVQRSKVLFATEKLLVTADRQEISAAIERAITSAGFSFADRRFTERSSADVKPSARWLTIAQQYRTILALGIAMLLATLVQPLWPAASHWLLVLTCLAGVYPIAKKAVNLALSGTPFAIETLMSVATLGALYLGASAEAGMVILLFLIGEELEGFAAAKARTGVQALMALVPERATKLVDGARLDVAASELVPGEVIEVAPGERLPADGQLIDANASFDESALTGESLPVEKNQSDAIMAGSVVVDRVVQIRITSKQGQNAIDRILHMIEEAELSKAPIERFLDRFSRWYTPLMMLVALLVMVIPPLMFAQPWQTWVYRGLATLLIACPCALVISTPAAITSGLAAAARRGALIKGGAALEQLGGIQTIAFDKTGTLTLGKPQVTDVVAFGQYETARVVALAAALEQGSKHPLAKALVSYAQQYSQPLLDATDCKALIGRGVEGIVDGQRYRLLSPAKLEFALANQENQHLADLEAQGKTVAVLVDANNAAYGAIAWQDQIRDDAARAIKALKRLDIHAVMLTGDNAVSAAALGQKVGIDYQANLLPEDKVRYIESLREQGKVAMVGDGINDAPAMKAAHLGVAMGGGSDVALETAEAALSHNRLIELANMIELSRATSRNIRQNITLALGLKAVFLVTSLLGISGLWLAVLADSGATALVTLNALRLLRYRPQQQ